MMRMMLFLIALGLTQPASAEIDAVARGLAAKAITVSTETPSQIAARGSLHNNWGVNLSVMEFNNRLGAVRYVDYDYPNDNELTYYASKGFGTVRLPFAGLRLYTQAFGPLDPVELALVKHVVDDANLRGLRVVLDPHDGGGVWDSSVNAYVKAGTTTRATQLFADFNAKLATAFKDYPDVVRLLLTNEPSGITAAQWKTAVSAAVTAIRAAGFTGVIQIPGVSGASALSWVSGGMADAFAGWNGDPLNRFEYEAHLYFDTDNSGAHYTDSDIAPVAVTQDMGALIGWARTNNVRVNIGEFGCSQTPLWLAKCQEMLNVMRSSLDVISGFSYWNGGTEYAPGYAYTVQPDNEVDPVDKKQLAVLQTIKIPLAPPTLLPLDFTTGTAQFVNETASSTLGPDENQSGTLIVPTTVNDVHRVLFSNQSFTSGSKYTITMIAKSKELEWLSTSWNDGQGDRFANCDVHTGETGFTSSGSDLTITTRHVGHGYYQCLVSFTARATTTAGLAQFYPLPSNINASTPAYAGDGTSGLYGYSFRVTAQ